MNKQELIKKRWNSLKLLSSSYNLTKNVIKFSADETDEHFIAKCLLCKEAKKLNLEFVVEAIFQNKSRADIFILDTQEAWEVLGSETMKEFNDKKVGVYPCHVIPFIAKEVIEKNFGVDLW